VPASIIANLFGFKSRSYCVTSRQKEKAGRVWRSDHENETNKNHSGNNSIQSKKLGQH